MTGRCSDCKFWGDEANDAYRGTEWEGLGTCSAVPYSWAEGATSALAVVEDASTYHAALLCKAEFGCVLHEKKTGETT